MESSWNYTPSKEVLRSTPDTAQSLKTPEVKKELCEVRNDWRSLGQDIDHLKYELGICMKKRMPKFDYDFPSFYETNDQTKVQCRADSLDCKEKIKRSKEVLEKDGVISDPRFKGFIDKFGYNQALVLAGQFDKHCWNCFGRDMLSQVRLPIKYWPK